MNRSCVSLFFGHCFACKKTSSATACSLMCRRRLRCAAASPRIGREPKRSFVALLVAMAKRMWLDLENVSNALSPSPPLPPFFSLSPSYRLILLVSDNNKIACTVPLQCRALQCTVEIVVEMTASCRSCFTLLVYLSVPLTVYSLCSTSRVVHTRTDSFMYSFCSGIVCNAASAGCVFRWNG